MRRLNTAALVMLFALPAVDADAQATVGAALGQSVQAAGDNDSSHLTGAFGGTSLAGVGMIDVAIRPHVTIGGEVSLAGDISGAQRERAPTGTNVLVSDHHDTVFSLLAKIGTADDRRVRVRAVIGGGIAQRHTERRGTFEPFIPTPFPPLKTPPILEVLSDSVLALAGGVDITVELAKRLRLLATGRLYQLKDDDRTGSGVVHRGVSSTIVRYGGGLQLRF